MIKTLIVEDDPMVAQLNQQYLRKIEDFTFVDHASTVDEAIEVLSNKEINLILLDIYMPKKNGFELLKFIRQEELNIDLIFITAIRDVESIRKAIQQGVVDYLIKPFTFERFSEALLNYRKRLSLMNGVDFIDQQMLDSILLEKEKAPLTRDLPKGLTKKTLKSIWNIIIATEEDIFSTEDIAIQVGLSRVSIGKYLHFLEDEGILSIKIEYGYIGRPVTKYQCLDKSKNRLQSYL